MQSKATTVEQYLSELSAERRASIDAVRKVILDNLDRDCEEGMQYGMIGYFIPHRIYPAGYHCDPKQPLPYACLASQKNYMSLYMMCLYADGPLSEWFMAEWKKTGKKLDMGKSCLRFKTSDDLALDVIGKAIRRVSASKYIEIYESAFVKKKPAAVKTATVKTAVAKKATKKAISKATKKAAKKVAKKKTPKSSK